MEQTQEQTPAERKRAADVLFLNTNPFECGRVSVLVDILPTALATDTDGLVQAQMIEDLTHTRDVFDVVAMELAAVPPQITQAHEYLLAAGRHINGINDQDISFNNVEAFVLCDHFASISPNEKTVDDALKSYQRKTERLSVELRLPLLRFNEQKKKLLGELHEHRMQIEQLQTNGEVLSAKFDNLNTQQQQLEGELGLRATKIMERGGVQ